MVPERMVKNPPWEEIMASVHRPGWSHDLSLVGLFLVVVGIIAAAVPCMKLLVDRLFSLIW